MSLGVAEVAGTLGVDRETVKRDIRALGGWKEVEVWELSVQADHVHLFCSVPPKLSISDFMGLLKGKLAVKLFKSYPKLRVKPYWGNHFWARGYVVTTVGVDEEVIRWYVCVIKKSKSVGKRVTARAMTSSRIQRPPSPEGESPKPPPLVVVVDFQLKKRTLRFPAER